MEIEDAAGPSIEYYRADLDLILNQISGVVSAPLDTAIDGNLVPFVEVGPESKFWKASDGIEAVGILYTHNYEDPESVLFLADAPELRRRGGSRGDRRHADHRDSAQRLGPDQCHRRQERARHAAGESEAGGDGPAALAAPALDPASAPAAARRAAPGRHPHQHHARLLSDTDPVQRRHRQVSHPRDADHQGRGLSAAGPNGSPPNWDSRRIHGAFYRSADRLADYYRELFFHIPFLIANQLNSQGRYEDAKYWYEKIFNPTAPAPQGDANVKHRVWQSSNSATSRCRN